MYATSLTTLHCLNFGYDTITRHKTQKTLSTSCKKEKKNMEITCIAGQDWYRVYDFLVDIVLVDARSY